MTRRWTLLAGAIALSLSIPQASYATPQAPVADPDPAAAALRELKDDAKGAVRVRRDDDGSVAFVSSTNGRAMLDSDASSPRGSVQDQLGQYGNAFGIDGATSKAVIRKTLDSTTGGSVVRADQVVDGVPVFGGQVVMSLDEDQGVVSVSAATTEADEVPGPVVSESRARLSALATTAKSHRLSADDLTATSLGRRLYDPALVSMSDPVGTRPVWQFEVTNGSDVRETVLVGTGRGEIALHFNDAPHLSRRICDNNSRRLTSSNQDVPICSVAARSEGGAASTVSDVNRAYANLGATSNAYIALDGIDLTELIGATVSGVKRLQATVRWCFNDAPCPYANAFWDGTQMVFGAGYAGADDVVAHELTHGYVERTSGLFYLHQSGAINESVSDVIGEIVDHRNPASTGSDANWTVGEDLPGSGVLRSLRNPPLYGQPDKMTSPNFVTAGYDEDSGAVHDNDGVGNKTAYLISQGGTFNGQAVTGIDIGDTGLGKTGRLYLETIPRLTSGADYAQLGDVLASTCQQLAGAGTGGFTPSDCTSVSTAVAATELSTPPTDAAATAPSVSVGCPTGSTQVELKRDDDAQQEFGFTLGTLWERTPDDGSPANSESGTSSLFGWNPDPFEYGDPNSSPATSAGFTVPNGARTYLNFHHAYLFEFYGTDYYDGGEVLVQRLVDGTWTTATGLPWVNGAAKTRAGTSSKIFGGDSHGYGSSQVDLTSLAGQTVRVVFQVVADGDGSFYGWWVDDIRLYACEGAPDPVAPTAPTSASVTAGVTSAVVSWEPPADPGTTPIASYRLTRSDGKVSTAPATAQSLNLTGLAANTAVNVSVAAVNQEGLVGPGQTVAIFGSTNTISSSTTRAISGRAYTVSVKVTRRGTSTAVAGMPVTLQRHVRNESTWRTVSSGPTSSAGTRSWSVKQSQVTYYRVISSGVSNTLGSTSAVRTIYMR